MASQNRDISRAVINLANACKNPDDGERIASARASLAALKVEDYIRKTLASAPPISEASRARLVRLLVANRGEQ